jgi:hypothetical protein
LTPLGFIDRLHWPPRRTGLGAPYLSALLSRRPVPPFGRLAAFALVVGVVTASLVLLMDTLAFSGVSLPRIRAIGGLPLWMRATVPVYAAVAEELLYRLGVMTIVVWVGSFALARPAAPPGLAAVWLGIGISALLFGLAHVGNVPDAPHPILRALTLNAFAGLVLGWLYWRKGFEAAVLAHFAADVFIYLVVASVL